MAQVILLCENLAYGKLLLLHLAPSELSLLAKDQHLFLTLSELHLIAFSVSSLWK